MTKSLLLTACCLLLTAYTFSQNLIPNPDFENYISCPAGPGETFKAVPWVQPSGHQGTSDYFNVCNTSPIPLQPPPVGVPANLLGNQVARTGDGYCGFFTLDDPLDGDGYREYIQSPLTSPLVIGETYCVRFYVSLSDLSTNSTGGIGAYFSTQPVSGPGYLPLNFTPQVVVNSVINNYTGWEEVYGTFTATDAFAYITIGSFVAQGQHTVAGGAPVDTSTFPPQIPMPGAYYYVEDVYVGLEAQCPVPCNLQFTNASTVADCNMSNGTAAINVTGGSGNYTYLWENGATTATLPGVAYGLYEVTVGDGPGCELTQSVFVGQNSTLALTFSPGFLQCASAPDGTVDIDVTGGTPPYTYQWSTGDTTQNLDSVPGGVYTVIVTDSEGCMLTDSTELTSIFASESVVTITDESCAGANNGSIYLTPGGPFPFPPTYLWSNGATTAGIYNLAPGTYTCDVTDFFGCTETITATVGSGSGSFNVNISQQGNTLYATPAPNYQWYFNGNAISGATQQTYNITQSGNYYVVATGGGTCIDTSNIIEATYNPDNILEYYVLENVSVFPNPASEVLNIVFDSELRKQNYEVEIVTVAGQTILKSAISNQQSLINISALSEGIYIVRISTDSAQRQMKLVVRK